MAKKDDKKPTYLEMLQDQRESGDLKAQQKS